jgi:hypothetical protein
MWVGEDTVCQRDALEFRIGFFARIFADLV